jgi:hypothetical protein
MIFDTTLNRHGDAASTCGSAFRGLLRHAACAVFTIVIAAAPVHAGQATRDTSAPALRQSSIRGRVIAASSRRPLRLARLLLSGPSLDRAIAIATDEHGQYEFRELPAGRYTVTADHTGYLRVAFGQRRPGGPARTIAVGERQASTTSISPFRG